MITPEDVQLLTTSKDTQDQLCTPSHSSICIRVDIAVLLIISEKECKRYYLQPHGATTISFRTFGTQCHLMAHLGLALGFWGCRSPWFLLPISGVFS